MAQSVASVLPNHILRNLGDKLYDKRKAGALDIEQTIKKLIVQKQNAEIHFLIQKLANDFARSPHINQRKGSLLGLAAVACGLTNLHIQEFLPDMVPPVLESVTDQDSRVRFYAVEALYNIADIARDAMLPFMIQAFDGLFRVSADADDNLRSAVPFAENLLKDIACHSPDFDIASFVPQLAMRMDSIKPYNRRFILGWIEALAGSTMIDILVFLPDLLDGIFAMLSDSMAVLVLCKAEEQRLSQVTGGVPTVPKPTTLAGEWQPQEIRHMAADVLSQLLSYICDQGEISAVDFGALVQGILVPRAQDSEERICVTALQWLYRFIELADLQVPLAEATEAARDVRLQLLPHFHTILQVLLHCISSSSKPTQSLADHINQQIFTLKDPESWGHISMEDMLNMASVGLESGAEDTTLLALRWINFLLHINQAEVLLQVDELLPALLEVMVGPSDRVVLESISVQSAFAVSSELHFQQYMARLVACFQAPQGVELLQRRGAMVLRRLCMLLGSERCFVQLASLLADQTNLRFASTMVQALNLILLTAPEAKDMRLLLQNSRSSPEGERLFLVLYKSWSHAPGAVLTLCFLAQAYEHAATLISTFGSSEWDVGVLVQLDRVVRLLEAPVFTFLRLQLMEPGKYPALMRALYGLLMILPQGEAFKTLSARLNAVPMVGMMQLGNGAPHQHEKGLFGTRDHKDKKDKGQAGEVVDFEELLQLYCSLQARHTAEVELHRNTSADVPEAGASAGGGSGAGGSGQKLQQSFEGCGETFEISPGPLGDSGRPMGFHGKITSRTESVNEW
eukprot:CAMPEP_0117652604 /NCGR_PEP_ID=MMETSP0804-20121206/2717_1 /TAXON_ID=1074897 /ORGANISM="Tetraselmis astigmatica, Strain CCMP880" /LENGTH=798 /DNA_ID=CAMNT_0005458665 /DNA_START=91 /DNA_END=2485 /DNA_ORIENTATION=+